MKFSYQINIERKELSVLNAVVESYIDLCKPISSNNLKKIMCLTPETPPKNALDLGCGYGPIAAVMEHRFPDTKIWGIDVNKRAIELAKNNTQNDETIICTPDEVPKDIMFDLIWSNPPIRIGKKNLKNLLNIWLGRLNVSGSAYLVINKNLGADSIQKWLENESWVTSRLKSLKGYRLLEVKHHV